jgi:DNA-binding NtrC family response regulator
LILSVIQIDLPPLRERGDDVLALADFYLKQFNQKLRKQVRGLTPEVADLFRRYPWPGNVRELRNIIERVMILEDQDYITINWLPRGLAEGYAPHVPAKPWLDSAPVPTVLPTVEVAANPPSTTSNGIPPLMPNAMPNTMPNAMPNTIMVPETISASTVNPMLPVEPPPPPLPLASPTLADRFPLPADGVELEAVELSLVEQALKRSGGNQTRAAELLRISRDQLRYRLKKLESGTAHPEASSATSD